MTTRSPSWAREILSHLPTGWTSITIGDLGELVSGSTPPRANAERYFVGGTIPWVKTGDLTNADVDVTAERITDFAVKECRCTVHPPGTVLVAMYGGFEQIGRTGILRLPAATNQAITAVRIKPGTPITPEFLQYWLNLKRPAWRRIAGSSRKDPNIAKADIEAFPVPVPSKQLVTKIDRAVVLFEHARKLVDGLLNVKREFKRGLMQQLLAGQKRFPEFRSRPWPLHRFDALCEELSDRNGKQLGADSVMGVIKGVGFAPMRDRVRGKGDVARYKIVPPGGFAYNPMRLNIGSIAFNDTGRAILVSPDYVVFRARSDFATPKFVNQLRYSSYWTGFMKRAGAGSVRVRIYFSDLARLHVPTPQLDEQARIADVLQIVDLEIAQLARLHELTEYQKDGLLARLLSRELSIPLA